MKRKISLIPGLIFFGLTALAQPENYSKLNDARTMKVQVVTDNILHITASPVDSFLGKKA